MKYQFLFESPNRQYYAKLVTSVCLIFCLFVSPGYTPRPLDRSRWGLPGVLEGTLGQDPRPEEDGIFQPKGITADTLFYISCLNSRLELGESYRIVHSGKV